MWGFKKCVHDSWKIVIKNKEAASTSNKDANEMACYHHLPGTPNRLKQTGNHLLCLNFHQNFKKHFLSWVRCSPGQTGTSHFKIGAPQTEGMEIPSATYSWRGSACHWTVWLCWCIFTPMWACVSCRVCPGASMYACIHSSCVKGSKKVLDTCCLDPAGKTRYQNQHQKNSWSMLVFPALEGWAYLKPLKWSKTCKGLTVLT